MSLFDAIHTANQALHVHRLRTEVAGENLAHVYTDPNYQRKVVQLGGGSFTNAMTDARSRTAAADGQLGPAQAGQGAIWVKGISHERTLGSERGNAMLDTVEMMRSRSAYELNVRAASMAKSMALSALEIGRG